MEKKLKKLSLNKEDLSMLNNLQMGSIRGGSTDKPVNTIDIVEYDGIKSCLLDEAIATTPDPISLLPTIPPWQRGCDRLYK